MKCPTCNDSNLLIAERQGIEIDYCPNCRGVWLDRGELDKIIERSVAPIATTHADDRIFGHGEHHDHEHGNRYPYGEHRKRGWLGDLFG